MREDGKGGGEEKGRRKRGDVEEEMRRKMRKMERGRGNVCEYHYKRYNRIGVWVLEGL